MAQSGVGAVWRRFLVADDDDLDEILESLKEKCEALLNFRIDEQIRIDQVLDSEEERRWLHQVQIFQKELDDIVCEASRERSRGGCLKKHKPNYKKVKQKVVEMLNKVDELEKQFTGLNNSHPFHLGETAGLDLNPFHLGETVGLELLLNQVWSCIEDENVDIIGLLGMGGVGKTTLLKRIHNEFCKKNKNDFKVVLWVEDNDTDTNKIIDDIGMKLRIESNDWSEISPCQKARRIYQVLKKENFVLMLNDIWGNLELAKVGIPLPSGPKYKSKILFTTRSKEVCAKMHAQKMFEVKCLSGEEAFSLFSTKVGEETLKCNGEIPELAREIAKECGGLPLALVAVGTAMAGVKSVDGWREAKSDLRSYSLTASEMKKVFSILKFSYNKLPDETHRRCFLYCSLYPEDYEVNVDRLIERWIGEGFLDEDKTKKSIYDMYLQGKSIIEKLKLSCLLEGVVEKECWDEPYIKMHDVIRDMALWLARDEDRKKEKVAVEGEALTMTSEVGLETLKGVERISIINADGRWQVPVCPNLITLCMQDRDRMNDYSSVQYMTKLKVLDLSDSDIANIPPEFGELINLEFLNLSRAKIKKKLPIELKNLKKLRIWLMENVEFSLARIPLGVIESLEQLKVFRFTNLVVGKFKYEEERRFLEKLESLPKLEELGIKLTTMAGMQKLHESPRLRGCLANYILTDIEEPVEMTELLECWSTMKHMKEGSSITYNSRLHNLPRVDINRCKSITHLTWLSCAPLLEKLHIHYCDSIEEVVKEDGGWDENDIFPNLTHLSLIRLRKLKIIHKKALPLPFLKFIVVNYCQNLRELPLKSKNTLIEIKGEEEWWNNLEWKDPSLKDQLPFKHRKMAWV